MSRFAFHVFHRSFIALVLVAEEVASAPEAGQVDDVITVSEAPEPTSTAAATVATTEREETPPTDADEDAEGEDDPDYIPSEGESSSFAVTPIVETPVDSFSQKIDDDDPFLIKETEVPPVQEVAEDKPR